MALDKADGKKKQTVKVLKLTDIKANKSKELIEIVNKYDVVILKMNTGDVRLSPVHYQ